MVPTEAVLDRLWSREVGPQQHASSSAQVDGE
jgi:hypothetical protein